MYNKTKLFFLFFYLPVDHITKHLYEMEYRNLYTNPENNFLKF